MLIEIYDNDIHKMELDKTVVRSKTFPGIAKAMA